MKKAWIIFDLIILATNTLFSTRSLQKYRLGSCNQVLRWEMDFIRMRNWLFHLENPFTLGYHFNLRTTFGRIGQHFCSWIDGGTVCNNFKIRIVFRTNFLIENLSEKKQTLKRSRKRAASSDLYLAGRTQDRNWKLQVQRLQSHNLSKMWQKSKFSILFLAYFSSFVSISSWQVFLRSEAIFIRKMCTFCSYHVSVQIRLCFHQNINRLQLLFSVLRVEVDLRWLTRKFE